MNRESAAARYQDNMLRRVANPQRERSLDEQISELRKLLSAKRASYQSRDRSVEYRLETSLLDLILQHPYKGAPAITSLNTSGATISAVDNRKALVGIDPNLLEGEYENIVRDSLHFFERHPYAVGVTGAGANGEPALIVIEYFDREAQARRLVEEIRDRSRLSKFDLYSDKFKSDFKNLAGRVRHGDPVSIALAKVGAIESVPSVASVQPPSVLVRKPKAIGRALEQIREQPVARAQDEALNTTALSPHMGEHTRRVKGRDYTFNLKYIVSLDARQSDKCYMEIKKDGIVVRSFWFKVDRDNAAKEINKAMIALDVAISMSPEPPEKNGFLNKLNRVMGRAVYNFGAM